MNICHRPPSGGLTASVLEYELENIESVVKSVLGIILSRNLRADEFLEIKDFLDKEGARIKGVFRRRVLSKKSEQCCRDYFTMHQIAVIEMLDDTFEIYSRTTNQRAKHSTIIEYLFTVNENLLSLIRAQFPHYFNNYLKAPNSLIEKTKQELISKMDAVQMISTDKFVEQELINPVLCAFQGSMAQNDNPLTFKQLKYLKLLQNEICEIDFSIEDVSWRRMNLCNVLIKLNFNDPQFFKFYTDHINKALLTCETLSDRSNQAAYFYKIVNQIAVIQGVCFNESAQEVKQQLLEWITCEIDYLNQKKRLQLSPSEAGQIKSDFKIIFDFSVSQLGYLFKLFIDTGLIQNKNASEVIRFLAKFVKTKKAESVSYESLRIKFYNTETGTKDAVRKTFQSLLSYINKN